ncbi:MAG: RICIN domain-containing protein, partial [Firmicutes bacterium]|nr:RICIN domain-containing protein [Bacillota bacterium]
ITSMCAERNLAPFYEKWGVYPSEDTIKKIKDYPSLSKSIWQSRDSTPVVEYNIPDNFVVPEIPSSQPPQNLDGQDIIIDSAIDLTFSVSDKSGKIQMWNNSSSSTNVWQIQASSNNTYLIKNKFTNQYIQEDGYGLSLNNNANNATKWDLIHLSSGVMGHSYRIKSSSSDLVFDVTNGGQPQNGTDVIAYPQTGNDNQRFFLDFINYDPPTTSPPPTEPPPVETVEPDQVTGLTLLKIENDIYLDWRESKNATHYRVYKSFDNVTYFIDSEQQDTNYLDKDATLYQMVMYFVKAVNNDIEGPDSITVEYESSDGSNETNENPKEVTGLQLLVVGNNLELIWNYVNNATYYRVYKSIEDSNYIIDSEQENIMYTDKGAAKYSKVNYFVRAVNNGVESGDGKIVEYTLSNNNGDNNDENNNSNNDLGDRNDIDIIITIAAICICIIVVLIFFNIIFVKKRY